MLDLQAMRERLETERQQVLEEIAELDRRLEVKPDYSLGAGDPAVYQWEFNLALRQQAQDKLEEIEDALRRLDEGRYGICEKCGGKIEWERLDLLPTTRFCATCAQSKS
ncbi:MAG: TraR/DksA C4-type zinc finger protein [Anaerolineae bacterium]|jgi:RNA polymerase-binding protein DksA|nr:TraR/DksA C4-type zinc finger protein [Anaerolineae bacterium]